VRGEFQQLAQRASRRSEKIQPWGQLLREFSIERLRAEFGQWLYPLAFENKSIDGSNPSQRNISVHEGFETHVIHALREPKVSIQLQ
jgi:hypothetical protein